MLSLPIEGVLERWKYKSFRMLRVWPLSGVLVEAQTKFEGILKLAVSMCRFFPGVRANAARPVPPLISASQPKIRSSDRGRPPSNQSRRLQPSSLMLLASSRFVDPSTSAPARPAGNYFPIFPFWSACNQFKIVTMPES